MGLVDRTYGRRTCEKREIGVLGVISVTGFRGDRGESRLWREFVWVLKNEVGVSVR